MYVILDVNNDFENAQAWNTSRKEDHVPVSSTLINIEAEFFLQAPHLQRL